MPQVSQMDSVRLYLAILYYAIRTQLVQSIPAILARLSEHDLEVSTSKVVIGSQ